MSDSQWWEHISPNALEDIPVAVRFADNTRFAGMLAREGVTLLAGERPVFERLDRKDGTRLAPNVLDARRRPSSKGPNWWRGRFLAELKGREVTVDAGGSDIVKGTLRFAPDPHVLQVNGVDVLDDSDHGFATLREGVTSVAQKPQTPGTSTLLGQMLRVWLPDGRRIVGALERMPDRSGFGMPASHITVFDEDWNLRDNVEAFSVLDIPSMKTTSDSDDREVRDHTENEVQLDDTRIRLRTIRHLLELSAKELGHVRAADGPHPRAERALREAIRTIAELQNDIESRGDNSGETA